MRRSGFTAMSLAAALALAAAGAGCHRDGCVGGDDGSCVPPSACPALVYPACAAPKLRVEQIGPGDMERVFGPKSLAAEGDYLLENDLVRVVLDAPDHPHFLAPSGGAILDLAPLASPSGGQTGDQINGIYHAAGVLPRDAVHYYSASILDSQLDTNAAGAYAAVIFRGHLEGDARVTVVTRYELRPCEPGVRVRSDLYNGASNANTLYLTDGFFWGDNGLLPFVPGQGMGFVEPSLDLLHLDQAWRQWPFLAARSQSVPDTAYAAVSCDRPGGAGFNSSTLTASGVPLGVTQSGDGFHFERFILAEPGPGLAPAVTEALRVRTSVHGDPPAVTVTGRVVANGVPVDGQSGRAASLLFYEPGPAPFVDDPTQVLPWNEVVPDSSGKFSLTLPPNRSYRVQPYAFGLPAASPSSFAVAGSDVSLGDLTVSGSAQLTIDVQSAPGVKASYAELVVIPVAAAPQGAPGPSLYSLFPGCAPMLGPPDGASPACNRALTINGQFKVTLPPGEYYAYVTRGPFASLDRADVVLQAGSSTERTLVVESLASQILPPGVISGDFHVHGGASFDSAIPDYDRVVSFLATGVDVIIATDHNVVTNYQSTLDSMGFSGAITVIPGVEQTPNILWYYVPGDTFPKTLGHFNFWPLVVDPTQPRNGAPWSELREPGQLMDDMDAVFADPTIAVRQLNHPYILSKLGRDQGYTRAIGYDPTTPIPPQPTPGASFAGNALVSAPGGHHRNIDWDVEEVMTGASRADWLRYRALWFSLLNQGFLRAGTANSDSHTLSVERIGYPRNLVWGGHDPTALDVAGFDADIRAGHLEGTNGPVLDVTIDDAPNGGPAVVYRPDLTPITVSPNAGLNVTVTAAPWIPVQEIRVFVNGKLVNRQPVLDNAEWFSTQPFKTQRVRFVLSTLLPGKGDAWLVVEAGMVQDTPPDTDGDGLPDLVEEAAPLSPSDPLFHLQAVAPGVWPTAFSNPFLFDLDGGGWQAPGLP
jgi:hypothetical protein